MIQQLKSAEEMPGSYGLPLLGETLELFTRDGYSFLWERFQRYGPVFKSSLTGKKCAILVGPDANKLFMQEKADNLSAYLGWKFVLEPFVGRPIFMYDGQEHRRRRRLMAPAFSGQVVAEYYFKTMDYVIQSFLKDWAEGGTIPLLEELRKLILSVSIRLFLGIERENEVEDISQVFKTLSEGFMTVLRLDIPLTAYGRARNASRQLRALLKTIIAERKSQGNLQKYRDALSFLLVAVDEDGNSLSESEVIDEALSLLNGAYTTTPVLISSLIFELSANPTWRERLRQEQKQICGEKVLALEHLKQFTQMTYVLKEVERLYPPSPFFFRGVVKDIEYGEYHIPAGWYVAVSPLLTHRMSEIYSEPNSFDPERFAPPREEDKQYPFSLVGFGGGVHNCLGFGFAQMLMKILLSHLLRHYDLRLTPELSEIESIRKIEMPKQKKFLEILENFRLDFTTLTAM
ncbi:cytochrome P450 [Oscillatoria salina]|uniref:cytochrome P450 n=1 Tax=Oscillatoria salina TaxID=331517 RepID=UPI001CCABD51|nr:cytochrome P450 [Oscillatoria salina]MBZ8180972.1 cytochrome P450 [Oscillatoria salina IIICB1]